MSQTIGKPVQTGARRYYRFIEETVWVIVGGPEANRGSARFAFSQVTCLLTLLGRLGRDCGDRDGDWGRLRSSPD
jgi:hypothetical protein